MQRYCNNQNQVLTINWNKYQSKVTMQAPNPYLGFSIDSSFQNEDYRTVKLLTVEINDYNDPWTKLFWSVS